MSAPGGRDGKENAVNAVTFRRAADHGYVVTLLRRTATHITFRTPSEGESTLPVRTFDEDFEPVVSKHRPMEAIPVSAAQAIADAYGYDQIVILARRVGNDLEPHGEHCTTYGRGEEHRTVAARAGAFLRARILGWIEAGSVEPLVAVMAERDLLQEAAKDVIEKEAKFREQLPPRTYWGGDPLSDAIANLAKRVPRQGGAS